MRTNRDLYYDFLRGIAIIMVIGIHTYVDGPMHFNLFLRQFLNCAVPIFLAISGYFIGQKSFEEEGSYRHFLTRQLSRVYIPMLIWSIPWFIISFCNSEHLGVTLIRMFTGDMSIFYFVILIMQLYVITPVIQTVNKRYGGGYSVAITIFGISLFDYCMRVKGMHLTLVESAAPFPVWMVFYVMGVLKAQRIEYPIRTSNPLCWAIAGIALCCCHIVWFYHFNGNLVHGIKLSAHIYSYFVISWLFSDKARRIYNRISNLRISVVVAKIGRWSFFIYLTHCLWLWALSELQIVLNWSIGWMLCIFMSFLLAGCFNRLCPIKFKRYVGF